MISRNEFIYIKNKLQDVEQRILEIEVSSELYKKWDKFNSMSESDKQLLMQKWDKYYEDCRNGYWGKRFFTTKEKFLVGEKIETEDSTQPLHQKPSSLDPLELFIKMEPYFELNRKKRELENQYNEYKDVFETKNNDGL